MQSELQKWMSSARSAVCDDIMDIAIAREQQVLVQCLYSVTLTSRYLYSVYIV